MAVLSCVLLPDAPLPLPLPADACRQQPKVVIPPSPAALHSAHAACCMLHMSTIWQRLISHAKVNGCLVWMPEQITQRQCGYTHVVYLLCAPGSNPGMGRVGAAARLRRCLSCQGRWQIDEANTIGWLEMCNVNQYSYSWLIMVHGGIQEPAHNDSRRTSGAGEASGRPSPVTVKLPAAPVSCSERTRPPRPALIADCTLSSLRISCGQQIDR
jgi:hypothetical protein